MFAAISPPVNSNRAIDVFFFETLDFDVNSPITLLLSFSTMVIVTVEQAISLASANWCIRTALTLFSVLIKLFLAFVRF